MEPQACSNCVYGVIKNETECLCKRHAPVITPEYSGSMGIWPEVKRDNWCGEYVEKVS